jgi:hypothetical protein
MKITLNSISDQAIDKISNMNLLDAKEKEIFDKISTNIKVAWDKKQIWRTAFEIEYGVLNNVDMPTPDAKYWQCLKELDAVFDQMMQTYYLFNEKQLKIEQLELKIDKTTDSIKNIISDKMKIWEEEINIKIYQNEIEKINYSLINMKQQVKDRIREMKIWSDMMNKIKKDLKFDANSPDAHKLLLFIHKLYKGLLTAMQQSDLKTMESLKYRLYELVLLARDSIDDYDSFKDKDEVLSLIELKDGKMYFKSNKDEKIDDNSFQKLD